MDRFDIAEASTGSLIKDNARVAVAQPNAPITPPDEVAECLAGYGLPDVPCLRAVAAEVVSKTAFPVMVKEAKKSYGWAYVVIPEKIRDAMKKIRDSIDPDDLHEDGKEGHPHVTSKYGLTGDDPEEVKKAVAGNRGGKVRMGKTSLFRKDDQDVLKVSVTGHALHSLWKSLSTLDNEDQFDEYVPHATLAYLKPGMGKKYAGLDGVDGMEFEFDSFMFEDAQDNPTKIALDGKVSVVKTATAETESVKLESRLVDNHGGSYRAVLSWKPGGRRAVGMNVTLGLKPNEFIAEGDVVPTFRVESEDGRTSGRWEWYFDGDFMARIADKIYLDLGQGWFVTGMKAACAEAKKILLERRNLLDDTNRHFVTDDSSLAKYPFDFEVSTDDMTVGAVDGKVKTAGEDIPYEDESDFSEGFDQSYQALMNREQERFTIKVEERNGSMIDPPDDALRGVFMSENDAWRFLIKEVMAKPELKKYRFMVSGNKNGIRTRPNEELVRELDEKSPGWTKNSFAPFQTTSGRKYAIQQRLGSNSSWFYWMSSTRRAGQPDFEIQSYDSELDALADRERGIQGRVGRGDSRVDPSNIRVVPFPLPVAEKMQLAGREIELNRVYQLHYNNGIEDEFARFVGVRNGRALFDFGDGNPMLVDENILDHVYNAFDFNSLVVGTRYIVTGMTDNNVNEGVFSGLTSRGHPKFELDNGSEISINPFSIRGVREAPAQASGSQPTANGTPSRYMIQHEFDYGWDYFGDGIELETYSTGAEAQEEINQVVDDSRGTGAEYEPDQFRVVPCLFQIQRENSRGEWSPVEGEPLVESASDATSRIMTIMELDSDGNYRGLPVPAEDHPNQAPVVQEEPPAREPTWVYQERALTEGQLRDLGVVGRGRTVLVTFARTSISERNRIGNRQDPELNRALAPMGINRRPAGRNNNRNRLVSTDGMEALRANPMFADSVRRFYIEHNMARLSGGEVWRREEASFGTVGEALSQMAADVSHDETQRTSDTRTRNARVVDGSGNERLNESTAMNTWLVVHDTGNIIAGEVPRAPMNAQFRSMYDALVAVENNLGPGESLGEYKIVGAWSGRSIRVPEARRMHNMGVNASTNGMQKTSQFEEDPSAEDFAESLNVQYQQELLKEKAKQEAKNEELKERARREQAKQSIPELPSMAFESLTTGTEYEWEPYRRDSGSPVPMPTRGILINTRHNPLSLKFEDADGSTFWVEWSDIRRLVPVSIDQRNFHSGRYVVFSFDDNGNLVMTPTPAGVEEASEMKQNGRTGDTDFLYLIDDHISNGWQLVSPEDVGAMTDALIITNDIEMDDHGHITHVGDLWSNFNHHQVIAEVDEFSEGLPVTWRIVDQSGQFTGFSVRNLDSNEEEEWFPDLAGASDYVRDEENTAGRKVIMDLTTNRAVEPIDTSSMRWLVEYRVREVGTNGMSYGLDPVVIGRTMSKSEANAVMDWFISDDNELIKMRGLVPAAQTQDITNPASVNVLIVRIDGNIVRQQNFIPATSRRSTASIEGMEKKAQFEDEFSSEDFAASMDAQYQQELLREKSKVHPPASSVPVATNETESRYVIQRRLRDSGRWRTIEWGRPASSFDDFTSATTALVSHLQDRPSLDRSEFRIVDRDTGAPVYETPTAGPRWLYAATPITMEDADRNFVPRELVGQTSITFTPAEYWRVHRAVSDEHHQDMVEALAMYGIAGEETENEYVITSDQLLSLSNDPRFGTDPAFFRWVTQREPAQATRPQRGFSVRVVDMDGRQSRQIALYPDLAGASELVLSTGGQNEVRRIIVDLSTGRQVEPVNTNLMRFVVEYRRIGYPTFTTVGRARTQREANTLMDHFMEDTRDIHAIDIRIMSLENGEIIRQETFVPTNRGPRSASIEGVRKEAQFEEEFSSEDFAASMDAQYQRELQLERNRAFEKANREMFVVQYHTTYGWMEVQWNRNGVITRPSTYDTQEAARTAIAEALVEDAGRINPRPTIAAYRVYSTKHGVLPNPSSFGFKVNLGKGADRRWETINLESSSSFARLRDSFDTQMEAEDVLRAFLADHPKAKPRDFRVVDKNNVDTDLPVIDENAAEEMFYVQWSRRGNFEFLRNGAGELMKFTTKEDARQFCQTVHGDKRIVSNKEGIVDEVGGIGSPTDDERWEEPRAFTPPYHVDIRDAEGRVTRSHSARGIPFAEADQAWGAANEWIQMSEHSNVPRSSIVVVDDNDRPVPRPPAWGPAAGEGFTPPFRVQYRSTDMSAWRQPAGGGVFQTQELAQDSIERRIANGESRSNTRITDSHGHVVESVITGPVGPFRKQLLANDGTWVNEGADRYDLEVNAWNEIGTRPNGIPNARRRVVDSRGVPVQRPRNFGVEATTPEPEPPSPSGGSSRNTRQSSVFANPEAAFEAFMSSPRGRSVREAISVARNNTTESKVGVLISQLRRWLVDTHNGYDSTQLYWNNTDEFGSLALRAVEATEREAGASGVKKEAQFEEEFSSEDFAAGMDAQYQQERLKEKSRQIPVPSPTKGQETPFEIRWLIVENVGTSGEDEWSDEEFMEDSDDGEHRRRTFATKEEAQAFLDEHIALANATASRAGRPSEVVDPYNFRLVSVPAGELGDMGPGNNRAQFRIEYRGANPSWLIWEYASNFGLAQLRMNAFPSSDMPMNVRIVRENDDSVLMHTVIPAGNRGSPSGTQPNIRGYVDAYMQSEAGEMSVAAGHRMRRPDQGEAAPIGIVVDVLMEDVRLWFLSIGNARAFQDPSVRAEFQRVFRNEFRNEDARPRISTSVHGVKKEAQFEEEFSSEDFAASMDAQYQQELLREKAKKSRPEREEANIEVNDGDREEFFIETNFTGTWTMFMVDNVHFNFASETTARNELAVFLATHPNRRASNFRVVSSVRGVLPNSQILGMQERFFIEINTPSGWMDTRQMEGLGVLSDQVSVMSESDARERLSLFLSESPTYDQANFRIVSTTRGVLNDEMFVIEATNLNGDWRPTAGGGSRANSESEARANLARHFVNNPSASPENFRIVSTTRGVLPDIEAQTPETFIVERNDRGGWVTDFAMAFNNGDGFHSAEQAREAIDRFIQNHGDEASAEDYRIRGLRSGVVAGQPTETFSVEARHVTNGVWYNSIPTMPGLWSSNQFNSEAEARDAVDRAVRISGPHYGIENFRVRSSVRGILPNPEGYADERFYIESKNDDNSGYNRPDEPPFNVDYTSSGLAADAAENTADSSVGVRIVSTRTGPVSEYSPKWGLYLRDGRRWTIVPEVREYSVRPLADAAAEVYLAEHGLPGRQDDYAMRKKKTWRPIEVGSLERTSAISKQAQFEEEFSAEDFAESMNAQYQQELLKEKSKQDEQGLADASRRYVVKWHANGNSQKLMGGFPSAEKAGIALRRHAANHPEMAKGLFSVQINDGNEKWIAGMEPLELYLMGSQLEVGTHYEWTLSPGHMGKTKGMFAGLTMDFKLRLLGADGHSFVLDPVAISTIRAAEGAAGRSPADGMFVAFSSSRTGSKAMLDARALIYPDVGTPRPVASMVELVMEKVSEWCDNVGIDPVDRWNSAVREDFEEQMWAALTDNPPTPPSERRPLNEIRGIAIPNDLVVGQSYEWVTTSGSRGIGAFVRKSNDEQPTLTFSRMPNAEGIILFEEGFEIPWADIREIKVKPIRSVLDLEPGSVYTWTLNNTNSGMGVFRRVSGDEGLAVFRHFNDPHNRMGEFGLIWRDLHSLNKVAIAPTRDAVRMFDEFNASGEGRAIIDEVLAATSVEDKAGEVMTRAGEWYEDEHPEDNEGWSLMYDDFRTLVERELSSFGSPQAISGRLIFGSFLGAHRNEVAEKIAYLQSNRNVAAFTSAINDMMVLADAWWQRAESESNPRGWLETWNGVRGLEPLNKNL